MNSNLTLGYDATDIDRWMTDATLRKAVSYVSEVSDVVLEGGHLSACVQGTRKRPYRVLIDLASSTRSARSSLRADCSCPVGQACKHIAAVLMRTWEAVHEATRESTTDAPTTGLLQHLSSWHASRAGRVDMPRGQTALASTGSALELAYVLSSVNQELVIKVYSARLRADGSLALDKPHLIEAAQFMAPPPHVAAEDLAVLGQLWLQQQDFPDRGQLAVDRLLRTLLATGRAWLESNPPGHHLRAHAGPPREGTLAWEPLPSDAGSAKLHPVLRADDDIGMVTGDHAFYLDNATGEVGELVLPVAARDAQAFLALPPIDEADHALTAQVLAHIDPALPSPAPPDALPPAVPEAPPHPVLSLFSLDTTPDWAPRRMPAAWRDFATLAFQYGDQLVGFDDPGIFARDDLGQVRLVRRDSAQERQWRQQLEDLGFRVPERTWQQDDDIGPSFEPRGISWQDVMSVVLPQLRASGWEIDIDPEFRHQITEAGEIALAATAGAGGWFDLALDVEVEGRTLPLAPMLEQLLTHDVRWTMGNLDTIADDEPVVIHTPEHGALLFQAGRLKPVVALLGDLLGNRNGRLRMSARDAGRLQALQENARLQFRGDTDTQAMVQRILSGPGLQDVTPPTGLKATLRDYQRQGLAWLQFLRSQHLAGVLADDMGLGKTLQTLAHILLEKEAGRLDRPALLVMPTSLLHNWQSEAARFAPALKVLALHGPQRRHRFEQIPGHDVVITTYPLLWRDQEALEGYGYHLLVLDEAQNVKNARSKAAIALRALDARHRLCLSGTPLENHLGELWAHFDFLLPGLLGTEKSFNQHWRGPIERGEDGVRARLLAQRVRPFILRRRKQDVATELPAKTVITRSVLLEGTQRDLYETVRATMEQKVREALTSKGLAKSHIVVLDALLKLRQACCDPRLLPGEPPTRAVPSAKLDLLMEMVPEMIEEGRRILLFSQFTSMLDLIGQALDAAGIAHVRLTGDTRDRATPIRRFTDGEVPLFLISLKAGGVGLNLTAADTVIHYDPWWNPAAEEQASDRAHRIGQDKPVFVYKLIAAGSIEERIVALQERKAALADAILGDGGKATPKFDAEDLESLLAPLPGANGKPAASRGKRGK